MDGVYVKKKWKNENEIHFWGWLILKKESRSSEKSVNIYQPTSCKIPSCG